MVSSETLKIHDEYSSVFTGMGCFRGTFSQWFKDDAKPYQVLLRCTAYILQESLKKELKRLELHQILAPLGVDETVEWCNSFVIVPSPMSHYDYV